MIERLSIPLVAIGRPAIFTLKVVARVTLIQADLKELAKQFPELFKGLGKMIGELQIKLQPNTTPILLTTPRPIHMPVRP